MLGQVTAVTGRGAQDRPGERSMTLLIDPGRKVIGDGREIETGLLGSLGMFLRHQLVAELKHEPPPPRPTITANPRTGGPNRGMGKGFPRSANAALSSDWWRQTQSKGCWTRRSGDV